MPAPSSLSVIGWREWAALPDLRVDAIKVKVDTGARTSALHAFDLEVVEREGEPWVQFCVHPFQRDDDQVVAASAPLLEERQVRSSNGQMEERPVILTDVGLGDQRWAIELTLTRRDEMGFRMLLGREAVRGRFVVDPGRSYLTGTPPGRRRAAHTDPRQR